MIKEELLHYLDDNPVVLKLDNNKGPLPLISFIEEALVIATSYKKNPRPMIIIKNNLYNAQRLYERIISFLSEEECALFGADESLRVEAIASSPEMRANKVETLASLLKNPNQIVVTCPSGILRHLPSPELFKEGCFTLKVGNIEDPEELKRKLIKIGYYQTSHIDQPLTFASRGGVIDIFSINHTQPVRIEFFDDEIESIRFFDVETQKTIVPIEEIDIVPANDLLFSDSDSEEIIKGTKELLNKLDDVILSSTIESDLELIKQNICDTRLYPYTAFLSKNYGIWDYMNHPLMIYSDEEVIEENIKHIITETTSYIQEMVQEKKLLPKFTVFHDYHHIGDKCPKIIEDPIHNELVNIEEVHLPNEPLNIKIRLLKDYKKVVIALNEKELDRIKHAFNEEKIEYHTLTDEESITDGFNLCIESFTQGFIYQDLAVISESELFEIHRHSGRYENKFKNAEVIHNYDELEKGDYVVHAQHGVGQYLGIETREIQGAIRDFLRIIYRGNAELLVPLEQFRLVRKFVSREGVVPKLNKLGSDEWEKTKKRLEENVNNIAERLVNLYSQREEHIGHAYQKDSELQKEFENEFEYNLTIDQAKAVNDVKKDMESDKPMDRLVCGDVGFGKTEIAIRAAFKAASENKQVAVLCPTTILAEQHFHTFEKRFKNYPFTIRVLDRFVTAENVKKTLKELKEGKVDILVGTHRLLSKDVIFKDLGLLVIDEEQRFGVEHKERIKEMKVGIDVLTLSATPIPRTLQMSLIGIRQLSQLETPPDNRYNVQTYVVEKNRSLVVDAIEKELSRDGQVFYLYNNIERIYNVARTLQSEIKDAKIGIVHGKMNRDDIEDVMMRFTNKELNILVCTTIIENGIDIPNANTILIDNAQDFGLAQIYQIKGRVGRSNRVAYAYLLVPPRKQLSETAAKRLQAVKEFAKLGSGYKIALRDLTIRGAGDILGPNQSGFIDTVGIDMYMEMLEEAINKKKGIQKEEKQIIKHANINSTSYIPQKFAPDDFDKLSMYQEIDRITSEEDLSTYEEKVKDEYGRLPVEVDTLFTKRKLDILLNDDDVDSYKEINNTYEITFSKEFSDHVDGVKLFEIFSKISKDINLRYKNQKITATIPKVKNGLDLAIDVIKRSKEAKK
ncbi:MAG: transcription-repair coupling factor [Erysipelotrichaceae bacterium]|nr:transcription-repair coupling factor [Erysipelotrichaceae bacterium]